MSNDSVLMGCLLQEGELTLEEVACACHVEPEWVKVHVEAGLFPSAQRMAGLWGFSSSALVRARRMYQLEHDFDAVPELAALVADMLEELDMLRAQSGSVRSRSRAYSTLWVKNEQDVQEKAVTTKPAGGFRPSS